MAPTRFTTFQLAHSSSRHKCEISSEKFYKNKHLKCSSVHCKGINSYATLRYVTIYHNISSQPIPAAAVLNQTKPNQVHSAIKYA